MLIFWSIKCYRYKIVTDIKDNILYDSIYVKFPVKTNLYSWKSDQWLSGFGGGGGDWLKMGSRKLFVVMKYYKIEF